MPADTSLSQAPSVMHGDASRPYGCHTDARPPGAEWAVDLWLLPAQPGRADRQHRPALPADVPAQGAGRRGQAIR